MKKRFYKTGILGISKIATLFTGALLCFSSYSYGQNLISADFTGQTLPTGWTNTALGTSSSTDIWAFDNPGLRDITGGIPGFDTSFAILDSDHYGQGSTQDASLETSTFDASTATGAIMLSFDNSYRGYYSSTAVTQVWDGTSWATVDSMGGNTNVGYPNPANHKLIDITTACGGATAAKVRFLYTGNWDYWWAIDNVSVDVVSCLTPTGLTVSNITSSSATLSWNIPSIIPGNGYDYYYNTTGTAPTATTTPSGSITDTFVNLTGLNSSNHYYVWVRSACSASDHSIWASDSFYLAPTNDECTNAIIVPVNTTATCTTSVPGTITGATNSGISTSIGTADDDVWFKFTASETVQNISLSNFTDNSTSDMVMELFDGCGGTSLQNSDPETMTAIGLTIGSTYWLRVFSYSSSVQTADFDVCITTPDIPANDECANATVLTCGAPAISGTTNSAISEPAPGSYASDYGVWYKFTGTGDNITVTSTAEPGFDHEIDVFSGSCGALTPIGQEDGVGSGSTETYTFASTIDTTYYFYVAHFSNFSNTTGSFDIAVTCAPPPSMAYVSSDVTQSSTDIALTGAVNQKIVRLAIVVSGSASPLSVSSIDFNTTGNLISPTPSDIAAARIYYTGTSSTFSDTNQFGSDIVNPSGNETITGSQMLTGGLSNTTNYFWLVYDISSSASANDSVDAEISSFMLNSAQTPATTNPQGVRPLVAPLVNDEASGAIAITVGAGCPGAAYTNENATASIGEPTSPITTTTNSQRVWFKFVAPTSGAVRITTDVDGSTGNLTDTRITLFSATDPSDYTTFTALAADDDNGRVTTHNYLSTLYATGLSSGTMYYVMVSGYSGTTAGTFCLTVDELTASMLSAVNTCSSSYQYPIGSAVSYTGQVSLVDGSGKLVAIVQNPSGGSANDYLAAQNINTSGTLRTDSNGIAYLDRNFNIENTTITNTPVNVTLFFLSNELSNLGQTLSSLNISAIHGAACSNDFNNGAAQLLTQTGNGSVNGVDWITFTTDSFSNFFIQPGNTPLPIKLDDIKAYNRGLENVVEWKSLEEQNSKYYELSRSADGANFVKIATIKAHGVPSSYTYIDTKPMNGFNYYRLAMVDNNGSRLYSKIVSASMNVNGKFDLAGFPNPTTGNITIKITGSQVNNGIITVTDVTGKVVLIKSNITHDVVNLSLNSLPAGTYFLKFTDNAHTKTIKITKK